MNNTLTKIISFPNKQIDSSIINSEQITHLVTELIGVVDGNIEGDVVEFGCYVGESSKYLQIALNETKSNKKLHVYDSFQGLPALSKWEENSGWRPGTLKTTEDVLRLNFQQNNLTPPIIHKDWFRDIPQEKLPNKISFAFLDGDFYDSIYDSLSKIYERMSPGGVILFHDFRRSDLPGVDAAIKDFFAEQGITYDVETKCNQLGKHIVGGSSSIPKSRGCHMTLVTGLWNIKRDSLNEGWSRSFQHYLNKFNQLLDVEENLIIFGDNEIEDFVWKKRSPLNTQFIRRSKEWFVDNNYYNLIQDIRNKPEWLQQAGWLKDSTQAQLEMYNPLVMSKMFLLNDARIMDKFGSEHLYWIDAGITNTVHPGYFTHDHVTEKIAKTNNNFTFICFPYEANSEVHGFSYTELCKLAKAKTNKVARGGFFGGPVSTIETANNIYYGLLISTLSNGLMGTEESLFTLMLYQHPELFEYAEIEGNGLISTYFENVKNNKVQLKRESSLTAQISGKQFTDKSALYVLTFNSPKQFATLIKSMQEYDPELLTKTTKFLLDNSTDSTTFAEYAKLCQEHNFEHIKKDNLGICGGRQFIAEHFAKTDLEYMMFFEDDMFFYPHPGKVCKNGFNRYVEKFYNKVMKIMAKESYDFLKFSFTEFYGNNSTQWSWYNVPQSKREEYWPNYCKLPEHGTDPNSPKTLFNHIKSIDGLPYVDGEVYYCNWPQIVSKEGNKKMFLDTTWAHPFEQTWMSHIYQLTVEGKINPALLLLSPTEHDRFEHYAAGQRKES